MGYQEHRIREFLDAWTGDLKIDYVVSPHYRTTNNIYSLWLAREAVRESFLLLECDLIFEPFLLQDMLLPDKMAVARVQPWMMGSTVSLDPFQRITDFHVGHSEIPDDSRYKTVNIYSLSLPSWRRVVERLDRRISAGKVNDYYEAVFAEMVADGSLSFEPVFFDDGHWYEVDTLNDLYEAERLFSKMMHREQPRPYDRLSIRFALPEYIDGEEVTDKLVSLFKALDQMNLAKGGPGLEVESGEVSQGVGNDQGVPA